MLIPIKKISISNFRIFKECQTFQFKPLTLITGPNNSGKSSFLKLLNLLGTSVEKLGSLNVLNFSEGNHNLGNFDNVLNWESSKNEISITFDFPLDYFDEDFQMQLVYRKMGEIGFIKGYKIFNSQRVLFEIRDINFEHDSNYLSFRNKESLYEYELSVDFEYIKKYVFYFLKNDGLIKGSENEESFLFFNYGKAGEDSIDLTELAENGYPNLKSDLLVIETNPLFQNIFVDNYSLRQMNSAVFFIHLLLFYSSNELLLV